MTHNYSKKCVKCGVEKPKVEFSTARQNADGKRGNCKQCESNRYGKSKVEGWRSEVSPLSLSLLSSKWV